MSRAASILALAGAVALATLPVQAHPLDEVIQAAYITLAPGEVQLDLEIQPGALVAAGIVRAVDANGDRRITDSEARAYAQKVLAASSLTVDGAPVELRLLSVQTPAYANLAQGDILHIRAYAAHRMRAGSGVLRYLNRYAPLKSQCQANVFLSSGGGWRYEVAAQGHSPDGRQLDVAYRAIRGA